MLPLLSSYFNTNKKREIQAALSGAFILASPVYTPMQAVTET